MNQLILVFLGIIGLILGVSTMFYFVYEWSDAEAKTEAQKIIDFRNTEYSCNQLKTFFLERYDKKYNSGTDLHWFWEVRDKLINNKCVDKTQLDNIEFIEVCQDGGTTGCEISKLENPELYENFNFRTAINNLKPINNGSESVSNRGTD